MHLSVLEDPKVDFFCESEEVGSSMSIATLPYTPSGTETANDWPFASTVNSSPGDRPSGTMTVKRCMPSTDSTISLCYLERHTSIAMDGQKNRRRRQDTHPTTASVERTVGSSTRQARPVGHSKIAERARSVASHISRRISIRVAHPFSSTSRASARTCAATKWTHNTKSQTHSR